VQKFITEQKLTLPIVLDTDGKICQTYNIAIFPATLVIGKDGKISETFVGIGPDSDEKLRAAVTAALEAK
jgi:peroxiredoxin